MAGHIIVRFNDVAPPFVSEPHRNALSRIDCSKNSHIQQSSRKRCRRIGNSVHRSVTQAASYAGSRSNTSAKERGRWGLVMLDQQPKERMPDLWSLSSVSLVLLKKSDLFKTVIPSKIFESMAMEKPIILGVEGESAELVMSAGGGVCIEPENGKDLADQVLKLSQDPARCRALGTSGRHY